MIYLPAADPWYGGSGLWGFKQRGPWRGLGSLLGGAGVGGIGEGEGMVASGVSAVEEN